MGEETFFYITKYWSTRGILKSKGRQYNLDYTKCSGIGLFKIGRDAFLTLEDARKRICELRYKKIKFLQKQLDKLNALKMDKIPIVEE